MNGNDAVATSGPAREIRFYPFLFSNESGFPQLQMTQEGEWRIQINSAEFYMCDDREAGEFIRSIGNKMIEEHHERTERKSHT